MGAAEEQGDQEGSRPRVVHPEAPAHHQDVLQVREEDGHKELRRPQEVVRGRRRGDPRRVAESMWKEKFAEFSKRPAKKLPKWFGVRPGKKAGDPETPEGEEEAAAEEEAEEEYEEEEKDYEEEEEEE